MSDVAGSISRLVEIARRLRIVADELGQVEIKSQIVDEISTLQEMRDDARDDGDHLDREVVEAEQVEVTQNSPVEMHEDAGLGIVEPTGKEETYSLTPEEENEPSEDVSLPGADADAAVDDDVPATATAGPNFDERRAVIEMRIVDLKQLEQVATKRMNDVPTAEQRQTKAKAQKAGRDAGKSGKELQQYAYGAMHLTPEQRSDIQAARKDVLSLREAIEKERESLQELEAADS
jgi:hypothetical protein